MAPQPWNTAGHSESHVVEKPLWIKCVEGIHHGGGSIGTVYRLLVGIGMLGMAISGIMIFFKIQARSKKAESLLIRESSG